MKHRGNTVVARNPLLLLEHAERCGIRKQDLMHSAGITAEQLADPDSRIPITTMRKLWRAVISRVEDPLLGLHVGQTIRAKQMGLVGYAMFFSENLLDAFQQLSRYGRIISEAVQFELVEADNSTTLRCTAHPFMIALRHPIEASMVIAITLARELTQTTLAPISVNLPLPQPDSTTPYTSVFRTTVNFDCPLAELTLAAHQMRLPTKTPDGTLRKYLDELAETKLRELGALDSELVDRVRRAIWSTLPNGKPDLHTTASQLGLSARTLQRRLQEAQTSFSAVFEGLRRDLSEELRTGRGFAAADIAFLLGYSESSAYQRAARRWRNQKNK